jgi:hypothetical protein
MNRALTTVAEPQARRRPVRRWQALLLAAVLGAAALIGGSVAVRQAADLDLAREAVVTTSSTAPGFAAPDVVSGSAAAPGASWQSDNQTVGAWVELSWSAAHDLHQLTIVRNPLAEAGITDGFLSFGDGSFLQVRLSGTDRATNIVFGTRSTDRVRFTASAVSPGARTVTIAEILVNAGPSDVVAGDTPDGNAAARAAVAESPDAGNADAHALQDGSGAPGAAGVGSDWTVNRPQAAWVQLSWDRPRELSSIELVGSPRSLSSLASARLTFSDGVRLPVGAVLADPGRPTIVAFMPRIATSLRLEIDSVSGPGPLALGELRVYERGATPVRPPSTGVSVGVPPTTSSCATPTSAPASGIVVACPQAGAAVDGAADLRVAAAPGYTAVTATVWPGDPELAAGTPTQVTPDPSGMAVMPISVADQPPGPLTVMVQATGQGLPTINVYLPLYRRGALPDDTSASQIGRGRTLVYAEEFDRPLSLSRTGDGADYATGKPTGGGAEDFGDAVFAGAATTDVVDGRYLRIAIAPGANDPQGWGRTHLGGLLASARTGGSGFSAQYGYFESRMLAPVAPGTWPAFWMLPADGLVTPTKSGAEIDAVERYGAHPQSACHSTHQYDNGKGVDGVARCGQRFPTDRTALAWHTYGVSITPAENVFFIDGNVVATAPQVAGGGAPMFFLVDLALGGGWPVDLKALQERTVLYVDYVRVYV